MSPISSPSAQTRLAAVASLTLALTALAPVGAAVADTRPTSGPISVATDVLRTAQMNGVAWTQVIVGNTVYVGGHFTTARPAGAAPGTQGVTRRNMLAYDVRTGALTSFAVPFNGDVRALAVSPDKATLYAAGSFTTAGGKTHNRLAAIKVSTGAVVSTFKPSLNGAAYAVAVKNGVVYAGGTFTSANAKTRTHVAAFSTGGTLKGFAPSTDLRVRGIVVSPDSKSVVLAGNFAKVNGKTVRGSGRVDAATGKTNQTWSVNQVVGNNGEDPSTGHSAAIYSLAADSTYVYATGISYHPATTARRMEGTYVASWPSGKIRWIEDCHGDSYSSTVTGGLVYIAGHPHDCPNVPGGFVEANPIQYQRGLAFSLNPAGTLKTNTTSPYSNFGGQPAPSLQVFFPSFNMGTITGQNQGPWSVASNSQYVTYAGEFTKVNGVAQQGLVRFAVPSIAPNHDGPRLVGSTFVPTLTAPGSGQVTVSFPANYDRDNERLRYEILRDGTPVYSVTVASRIWFKRPTITWTDGGLAGGSVHEYRIRATDPYGNSALGSKTSITVN